MASNNKDLIKSILTRAMGADIQYYRVEEASGRLYIRESTTHSPTLGAQEKFKQVIAHCTSSNIAYFSVKQMDKTPLSLQITNINNEDCQLLIDYPRIILWQTIKPPISDQAGCEKLERLLQNTGLSHLYSVTFDKDKGYICLHNLFPVRAREGIERRKEALLMTYLKPYVNNNPLIFRPEELMQLNVEKTSDFINNTTKQDAQKLHMSIYQAIQKVRSTGSIDDGVLQANERKKLYTERLRDLVTRTAENREKELVVEVEPYFFLQLIIDGANPVVTSPQRGWNVLHILIAANKATPELVQAIKNNLTAQQWNTLLSQKTKGSGKMAVDMTKDPRMIQILQPALTVSASSENTEAKASISRFTQFPAPTVAGSSSSNVPQDQDKAVFQKK